MQTETSSTLPAAGDFLSFTSERTESIPDGRYNMRLTTLCYLEKDGCYLMMNRVKKQNDENQGKWIGVGGHLEENESPDECIQREVREETGAVLTNWKLRGILTFILPDWGNEMTFLYTGEAEGDVRNDCEEGVLKWIPRREVMNLPLWEGDRVFLPLLESRKECFSLKLVYAKGGRFLEYTLDGKTCMPEAAEHASICQAETMSQPNKE